MGMSCPLYVFGLSVFGAEIIAVDSSCIAKYVGESDRIKLGRRWQGWCLRVIGSLVVIGTFVYIARGPAMLVFAIKGEGVVVRRYPLWMRGI